MITDINEAKKVISDDFLNRYYSWLEDYNNKELSDRDYGHKYGWGRGSEEQKKDLQKNLLWFQSHVYSGRYINGWPELGIDRNMVYQLHREGFFSYDYCTSYKARCLGKTDFYYLNQAKVKEIWKANKN